MLTIWTNAHLPESTVSRLRAALQPDRLVVSPSRTGNLAAGGTDPRLEEADIAFGQPDPNQLLKPLKLKWIQLTSAGYTRYDRPDLRQALGSRGVAFTNSSSVLNEPCSQHVLAFMLAHARALPQSLRNQFTSRAWPIEPLRLQCKLLSHQRVLILGFGAIARRLTELLAPFHLEIQAVRQTPRGNEPIPVHPVAEIDRLLAWPDHLVNILPWSPATERFMTAKRFAAMKPGSTFYNIGRGNTVDQNALLSALSSGHIGAAYLDVTEPEPLPPDHPLWSAPNCYITPHIAGGHIDEFDAVVDHFLDNLSSFREGAKLRDRVF